LNGTISFSRENQPPISCRAKAGHEKNNSAKDNLPPEKSFRAVIHYLTGGFLFCAGRTGNPEEGFVRSKKMLSNKEKKE
jgi:hypothetical protein